MNFLEELNPIHARIDRAWKETVEDQEVKFFILRVFGYHNDHYCGYCGFKKRPLKEPRYRGIATYVNVHGGITFAAEYDDGFFYGFDCNHSGDRYRDELYDIDWLSEECVKMARGILKAKKIEEEYLVLSARNNAILDRQEELAELLNNLVEKILEEDLDVDAVENEEVALLKVEIDALEKESLEVSKMITDLIDANFETPDI